MQNQIKILSQGKYGCVLRKGVKCDLKTPENSKYVTKIQKKTNVFENEVRIGKRISQIPNYTLFFSPVISTCDVVLGNIENEEIRKCEILDNEMPGDNEVREIVNEAIDDVKDGIMDEIMDMTGIPGTNQKTAEKTERPPPNEFVSSKIRYVGNKTLAHYLQHIFETDSSHFIRILVDTQMYLLNSVRMLYTNKIVHFDIKENNILHDPLNHTEIIIDFGLSFDPSEITWENENRFFPTYEEFPSWSIEIFAISFMKRIHTENAASTASVKMQPKQTWADSLIPQEQLKQLCNEFFTHPDSIFMKILSEEERNQSVQQFQTYFISQFENKSWKYMFDELMKTTDTWDTYSIVMMYIYILHNFELFANPTSAVWNKYIELLRKVILALPGQRDTPETLQTQIYDLLNSVPKEESDALDTNMQTLRENNDSIQQNLADSTYTQLADEDDIMKHIVYTF